MGSCCGVNTRPALYAEPGSIASGSSSVAQGETRGARQGSSARPREAATRVVHVKAAPPLQHDEPAAAVAESLPRVEPSVTSPAPNSAMPSPQDAPTVPVPDGAARVAEAEVDRLPVQPDSGGPDRASGIEEPRVEALEVTEHDLNEDTATVKRRTSGSRGGRMLSVRSEAALKTLGDLDSRLAQIENRVAEMDALVRGARESELDAAEFLGQLKTELALLEAEANKLETCGVDSVYTCELESGKADAKAVKKVQLQRLEALFTKIEDVFAAIKQASSP